MLDAETNMKELQLSKAFQLIEPGPVVLVTTAHKGKANIMTMSWHMVMDFTPQIAPGQSSPAPTTKLTVLS